jgi:hypothetical protein
MLWLVIIGVEHPAQAFDVGHLLANLCPQAPPFTAS